MKAIKVQFKTLGKRYTFSCEDVEVLDKMKVVVDTIRGLELGETVGEVFELADSSIELKPILRVATTDDINAYEESKEMEPEIIEITKGFCKDLELEIKILSADYTLDRTKLIIYFESEERVDFRDLVRALAEQFKVRIELRQVGARDGAKTFGAIGPCGLIVCCKTFLNEFVNVTVKMAKNQGLSLNPLKISGSCGKLLCCINYENEHYKELRLVAPDVNDIVETENGEAKVLSCDVLNKTVKVKYFNEDRYSILKFDEIKRIERQITKSNETEEDD